MSKYPSLFQVNTRVFLTSIAPHATLDDISDHFLDNLAATGFSWLWPLGVWQVGDEGPYISAMNPQWRADYERVLPDLRTSDICGSPFAVYQYMTDYRLGGDAALARLRKRLHTRGMKLLVDFVPNHVALDHPWTKSHPEFLMHGTKADVQRSPYDWTELSNGKVFAHGRDPNYPGWVDTLQLNYFDPALQEAMKQELLSIAARADGVRCDMAMLLEPEVFERTWGRVPGYEGKICQPFWADAIQRARATHPNFLVMAEVYWNYEHKLQTLGFDYTYDKVLYDRLAHECGRDVRHHLLAEMPFQQKSARFLENHDEPRIASVLPSAQHRAAAAITFFAPGLRFFHHGQLEGFRIRIPVHLCRGPAELIDQHVKALYETLLPIIHSRTALEGSWSLRDCRPAWDRNATNEHFVCQLMQHEDTALLVTVNYAPQQAQCFVQLPHEILTGNECTFRDLLSDAVYTRSTSDLKARGLYLDTPDWHVHIFELGPS